MPYSSVDSLPPYVKKYSSKIKRMWMSVFNSTYKKVLKETDSTKQADVRAFKSANSVVKKNMEKFGYSRYGDSSYFSFLVDSFLENI